MATEVLIRRDPTDPKVRLRGPLTDKRPVLKQIGALLESESQRAFSEQRLGEFAWPPRYPNQSDPFINIAGALRDFSQGSKAPKARRFQRRPALIDTGNLRGSIRSRVSGETVEVGSNLPYASVHQAGGVTEQRLTKTTREVGMAWLLTPAGRPYFAKLAPILRGEANIHFTEVNARPFVGVPRRAEPRIAKLVEMAVKRDMEAGNG